MFDAIINFSIRNKLIVGLFTVALAVWGLFSLQQLPIDALPDITNNQVQVITRAPALAAQEIERLITFPIEQSLAIVPRTVEVRSISRFGLSVVTVVFEESVDLYWARQQVSERLSEARANLPPGLGNPELAPISTGLGEVYQYVVFAKPGYEDKYDATELRTIQDWLLRRQLLGTPGIAEVNSFGGFLKQYEVAIDPDKLRSFDLTLSDIFTALEVNNQNTGGAYIDKKPNAYFIRSEGLITSLDDIANIKVKMTENQVPVLIKDVAKAQLGHSVRYGALTRNGKEAVGGIVMMLKGENANQLVSRIKERIEEISKSLPEGVGIDAFLDRSSLVQRAINTVSRNLVEGALIVIVVLVLFLGNLRAGLVVASVIPLSLLFAIGCMNTFGVSGNLMSLGAIDFGLVVDGAVIIVEATLHHFALIKPGRLTQDQMDKEVFASASGIRKAAAFGEIIILIVYLPILALVGIEGKMFRPMAMTVGFAIMGAFILSLTYVPMMSALVLSKKVGPHNTLADRVMARLTRAYEPIVRAAARQRRLVVLGAAAIFAVSVWLFTGLGGEFIPTLEEGDFAVETRLLTGSSLSQTIDKVNQASNLLLKEYPEVKEVVGKIGAAEVPTDPMPVEACDITILLKDKSEWTSADNREELANKMSETLEAIPGVSFGFSQPIQLRSNELISGVRQDVGIKIFGEDLEQLTRLSRQVGKVVASVEGATDMYLEQLEGLPQVVIRPDRAQLARFDLDINQVNQAINTAFAGQAAGMVYEGEKRFEAVVRLQNQSRQDIEDVRNLYLETPLGSQVPLRQVASVEYERGPNQVQRENTRRRIIVGFNVRGRDVASVVKEVQAKLAKSLKLPPGYSITYGGQFRNLEEAQSRLSIAVPIALALIFLLLFLTFGTLSDSLLIFSAIPMAATGGVFALILRDMPFSISAGIGFIALFGVAVLNGIVLIGEFNRLKKEGYQNLLDVVVAGTQNRLRPVLMTAAVASLGFLPMAISHSAGAEVQKPLATVVIGGLITSTILTLIVLPALYLLVHGLKRPSMGKAVVSLLVFLLPLFGQAQTAPIMNADVAVRSAFENNQGIRSAQLETQGVSLLRGARYDFGRTNFGLVYGQYNSYASRDNNFTISQAFPFPTLFAARLRAQQAQLNASQQTLRSSRAQLRLDVQQAYFQLAYLEQLGRFLRRQDSLLTVFQRTAQARVKAGEAAPIEALTAQTRARQAALQSAQNQVDIGIETRRLLSLTQASIDLPDSGRLLTPLPFPTIDTGNLSSLPIIAQAQASVQQVQAERQVMRRSALPDITVGYFNQTLYGTPVSATNPELTTYRNRFQGIQLGLAVPLWYRPTALRSAALGRNEQAAQARLSQRMIAVKTELANALADARKFQATFSYYAKEGLAQARSLVSQARAAYQAGESGYPEFVLALTTAAEIETSYLQAINNYNQAVLRIEFLTNAEPLPQQ